MCVGQPTLHISTTLLYKRSPSKALVLHGGGNNLQGAIGNNQRNNQHWRGICALAKIAERCLEGGICGCENDDEVTNLMMRKRIWGAGMEIDT